MAQWPVSNAVIAMRWRRVGEPVIITVSTAPACTTSIWRVRVSPTTGHTTPEGASDHSSVRTMRSPMRATAVSKWATGPCAASSAGTIPIVHATRLIARLRVV